MVGELAMSGNRLYNLCQISIVYILYIMNAQGMIYFIKFMFQGKEASFNLRIPPFGSSFYSAFWHQLN